jgi:hypothetical protein
LLKKAIIDPTNAVREGTSQVNTHEPVASNTNPIMSGKINEPTDAIKLIKPNAKPSKVGLTDSEAAEKTPALEIQLKTPINTVPSTAKKKIDDMPIR